MRGVLFLLMLVSVTFCYAQDDFDEGIAKAKDSKKYSFKVSLTNGMVKNVESKFMIDYCNKLMFIYDENEEAIFPQNTYSLEYTNKKGEKLMGYPTDSLWLFQTIKGKISVFATKPETKLKHAEFFTKKESSLIPFTTDTLVDYISDDADALKAYKLYNRNRKWSARSSIGAILSAVAHVYAPSPIVFNKGTDDEKDAPVYLVTGGISALGIVYFKHRANKKLKQAIEIYNK